MKSFTNPLTWHLLLFLMAAFLPVSLIAQDKEKTEEAPAAETATPDDDFDLSMIPPGQPVKGLKIPYYGADGTTLQMTFEAEVARRIDDANIELDNLKIDAVGDDEKKFLVEMPQSVFNIESRMLTGENGVLIKRDDFEIRGKAAEFDIKSRFGKVLGNVHMIIYSTEDFE